MPKLIFFDSYKKKLKKRFGFVPTLNAELNLIVYNAQDNGLKNLVYDDNGKPWIERKIVSGDGEGGVRYRELTKEEQNKLEFIKKLKGPSKGGT